MDVRVKVMKSVYKTLQKIPNFAGAGIGKRIKNGQMTDEDVIHVLVNKKIPATTLRHCEMVPKHIWTKITNSGIPTDVISVGHLEAFNNTASRRPLCGGISVFNTVANANPNVQFAGTLGGIFLDKSDNTPVLLSNNHVFARQNQATIGEGIEQPASLDDPGHHLVVGHLKRFVTLQSSPSVNSVDGAIASLDVTQDGNFDIAIHEIGLMRSVLLNPYVSQSVMKSGRTSDVTRGQILSLNVSASVSYDSGTLNFENQYLTSNILQSGDSGSLVVSSTGELIGLGFAGSDSTSLVNPIQLVFDQLNIEAYQMIMMTKFRDPAHGGFLFKADTESNFDGNYSMSLGKGFMLFPITMTTPSSAPFFRWKSVAYPYTYALGKTSPGSEYIQDALLGRIDTARYIGTTPLYEFTNTPSGLKYYSIDPSGDGINMSQFTKNPTPLGYVANIRLR